MSYGGDLIGSKLAAVTVWTPTELTRFRGGRSGVSDIGARITPSRIIGFASGDGSNCTSLAVFRVAEPAVLERTEFDDIAAAMEQCTECPAPAVQLSSSSSRHVCSFRVTGSSVRDVSLTNRLTQAGIFSSGSHQRDRPA